MVSQSMTAGMLAGAITIVLAWVVKTFAHIEVPAEVGAAVGVILQAGVHEYFPEKTE